MKRLFNGVLSARDFGRAAVRVADLVTWAQRSGMALPADVASFDVAHIETLLCAIEDASHSMTDDEVLMLAATLPCDPRARAMIEEGDPTIARWLVGANTHRQWRDRLQAAIAAGELATIDALTGMPMTTASTSPGKRWTTAARAELVAYREAHGTKAAAEHFNITAARIRALLPRAERGTSTVPGTVHRAK